MTRTITITSLALRSVVSLQVALCTSMIAALVLEKRSARKSDVAYLSIARSISDGPRKMVQLLLSSRSRSVLTYVELWLICLLALVMLVLQFSSTLLLSDLHNFVVVGDVEAKSIANFYSPYSDNGEYRILWSVDSITPTYAVFGEESSNYNITPDTNGFSDTGTLRRGYLPLLGSDNRTSVRKYHGSTLVVNSRIVCVPPEMEGHIYTDELVENYGVGHMVGTVNYGRSLRHSHKGLGPLCADHGCESVPFDCTIPGSLLNNSAQSNFCFIETVGRTSNAILLVYPSEYTGINLEAEPWSLNSSMFLVIRSNVTHLDWPEVVNHSTIPPAIVTGEWNRFQLLDGGSFDVSLCFQRFYVQPQYTNMIAHQPAHEPIVIWDGFNLEHDTTALASFVSANSPLKPPVDRGLLDMDILPKPDGSMIDVKSATDGQTPAGASAAILQAFAQGAATNQFTPGSIAGCELCNDISIATIPEIALLFTDIIEATGRAAAALHSLTALVSASVYDKLLKVFNATEEVNMAVTTSVRTPGPCSQYQCSGFISVTTLLGVHMVIVATITTLYVSQVRYSRCSNTWHAVSQLMSEELEDVLNQGNNAEDKTITRALKRDEKDDFVKLGLAGDSIRVQVVKHADDNRRSSEDEGSLHLGVKIKQCAKRWFRRNEVRAT
ncbi:hypothetical protein HD806DRAFT_518947 [Xylariaceae sp. AK1471]|nr:hypothetical protein HD806DRAFT_518947 [Xylariaceae sp. AK1471]